MAIDKSKDTKTGNGNSTKSSKTDARKRRLAEQLRANLRNRKAQANQRRNFDKSIDD